MDFGTSVSHCSLGSAGSMGCSVLLLCLHPVLDVPPVLGTALSLPPQPALLLALLWAGPQILLELGLLEQTSHSCCLWQLSYAQLYSPVPCPACPLQALGLVFRSGVSVFGAQVQAVGQGSCGGTAQERLWLALGITWEKLPGMIKGIVWTWARER